MKRLLILLITLCFSVSSWAIVLTQTTASYLNVRAKPYGEVLFVLPQDSFVGVIDVQGKWARIVYLPNSNPDKAKYGWVSKRYLKLIDSSDTFRLTDS